MSGSNVRNLPFEAPALAEPAPSCSATQARGRTISERPFLQQALRGLGILSDKVTAVALQLAPEGTPPAVVRTAVTGGLLLLAASFIKGILSVRLRGCVCFTSVINVPSR